MRGEKAEITGFARFNNEVMRSRNKVSIVVFSMIFVCKKMQKIYTKMFDIYISEV